MRVAAIYDVHGNLPALEMVLRDVRQAGVDHIVVGGDAVPGPMPTETLRCLLALDMQTHFLQGNGEADVLKQLAGEEVNHLPESVREIVDWTGAQLDGELQQELRKWPSTLTLEDDDLGRVLFCHATPRNNREIFSRLTSSESLSPVFAGVDASLVVCGHTHMQFDRMVGGVRVVNAGSVGMPFGRSGAYWLLLNPDVQLRRSTYDLERAAERIRATEYPQATEFAERNVLKPPSEAAALARYAKVELR